MFWRRQWIICLRQLHKEPDQVKESVIIKNTITIFSRDEMKNIQRGKELKYISGKVCVISSLTTSRRKWYRLEAEIWEAKQREISKNMLKNSRNPTQGFFQLLGWRSSWLQATMQEWTGKCSNVTQMSQQSVNPWFWQQFSGIQEMTVVRCWCFLLLCFASRMRENKTWKVNTDDGKLRGCSWGLFFPPDVWSHVCWRKYEEQMFALSSVCLWRM